MSPGDLRYSDGKSDGDDLGKCYNVDSSEKRTSKALGPNHVDARDSQHNEHRNYTYPLKPYTDNLVNFFNPSQHNRRSPSIV